MKKYAIIVAGGSGNRMGTVTPKQFLLISGKPILMYSIEAFGTFLPEISIILVLPELQISNWQKLCTEYNFPVPHTTVAGGAVRGNSVKNGLDVIKDTEALVAVHDGVRPFPDPNMIKNAFNIASDYGTAVPAIALTDSIRIITDEKNHPFDRNIIRRIQTPQCFRLSILKEAYEMENFTSFTDDAGLVETLGYNIHLIKGNQENIKITTPFDLMIAEAFLSNRTR